MLSNISINSLHSKRKRPQNICTSQRIIRRHKNMNAQLEDNQEVNLERIKIPKKEEENISIRETKPQTSIFAPAIKGRILKSKFKNLKTMRNKENKLKTQIDTDMSVSKLNPLPDSKNYSMMTTPISLEKHKISTSRALQMFSKVYRKQEIERVRLKKQLVNKTANMEIRKMVLMDKEEKEKKKVVWENDKKKNSKTAFKKIREKTLFDDDNFELAGW